MVMAEEVKSEVEAEMEGIEELELEADAAESDLEAEAPDEVDVEAELVLDPETSDL